MAINQKLLEELLKSRAFLDQLQFANAAHFHTAHFYDGVFYSNYVFGGGIPKPRKPADTFRGLTIDGTCIDLDKNPDAAR